MGLFHDRFEFLLRLWLVEALGPALMGVGPVEHVMLILVPYKLLHSLLHCLWYQWLLVKILLVNQHC